MHIKSICLYVFLCCLIFSFLPACNDDKNDFEEMSRLIASRNEARYKKAEHNKKKEKLAASKKDLNKNQENETTENQEKKKPAKKKFSTEIFYEEEIKIIASSSNSTLGTGTAYLNKDGKIVQIKIKRD